MPLVPMSVYVLLHVLGVFRSWTGMPRVLYVVAGMSFWTLWSDIVSVSVARLNNEVEMVKRLRAPLIVIYLTGVGQVLFDTMVRLALLVTLLVCFGAGFGWQWLMLPVLLLPLFAFGLGLGILLSFFAVFTRDVNNAVAIVLRYGVFLSGVIFPLPAMGTIGKVVQLNPMFHMVDGARSLVVNGYMPNVWAYCLCAAISVCICIFALNKSYSMHQRLAWAL
jgi:lipopolysaccharide transport system permease protein